MNRIRDLRKESGLSQEQLAKKFNLSQQTISSYEICSREPDNDTLKQLASFFGVSVDYLLGQSNLRNSREIVSESSAPYSLDVSGLPEEAIKQVEEYLEFLKQRYIPDKNCKNKKQE